MSKQYPGGIISKTPVTPSGSYETSTASGIWTLDQQAYWAKLGQWPTAGNPGPDAQFNYVTMLLHGDGTNGAQNNTFLDSSTNNFAITRGGNTTQGSFSPYGSNWSNNFDGTGDYVQTGNATNLALGTDNFTIEGWFNRTSGSNNGLFQLSTTVGGFKNGDIDNLAIGLGSDIFYYYANNNTNASSTVSIPNETWHHFALVRNGTTTTLYYNGVSVGSISDSKNYTATYLVVGGYYDPAYVWNGYISNLRIVKGTAVYTSNFTPPTAPLSAITNTQLLTCQANRFIDSSVNAYALTVSGNTRVQRFNPFGASAAYSTSVIGGSGYFDGNGDTLQATAGAVPAIGTGNFTLSGWWYLNELKNYQILFDFRNGTNVEAVPYLYVGSTGLADYYLNGSSNNLSINFRVNEWSYVVVSRVSGTTKIFINGAQALSISDSTNYVAGRLNFGFNNSGGAAYYYNGYISDFKLVIGTGTTSGTPTTAPATATSGTQALLSMTNGAIFDNAMMNNLETAGNAQISTSVVKYGTGSLAFDGASGTYLALTNPTTFAISSGDFTIEGWLNAPTAAYDPMTLMRAWTYDGTNFVGFRFEIRAAVDGGKLGFYVQTTYILEGTYPINTWFHFAVVKSGSTAVMYINGVATSAPATCNILGPVPTPAYIGIYTPPTGYLLTGYMDDVRITKGYARYTANFTPPTAAFFNYGPT